MSSHAWLTKPTPYKSEVILKCFRVALRAGLTPVQAAAYAGVNLERRRQGGHIERRYNRTTGERVVIDHTTTKGMRETIRRSQARGLRFFKRIEYVIPFLNAVCSLVPEVRDFDSLSVASDYLEERGLTEKALILRTALEATTILGRPFMEFYNVDFSS